MIAGRPSEILRQLEERTTDDGELLSRFIRERDQSAFAEIVRAHGPVVLGLCRRVTGHPQDAEDAFQVVFLSLAQKATTIRNPGILGGWLYGVAVRVARKARRSAIRRRAREVTVSIPPDKPSSPDRTIPELSEVLDEELATLPSWYRDAIVLCDLRGISREEAAKALRVPEGTLSSRLANGRKRLAVRLTKRGVALSAAAISTSWSTTHATPVPHELLAKTCGLAADIMAGGTVPSRLAKLSGGGMTVRKTFTIGLVAAVAVAAGIAYGINADEKQQPVVIKAGEKQQPAETAKLTPNAGMADPMEGSIPDRERGDKPVIYASNPRLRDSLDIDLHVLRTIIWNPQGDRIAISGRRFLGREPVAPEGGSPAQPKGGSTAPPKKNNLEPNRNQLPPYNPFAQQITRDQSAVVFLTVNVNNEVENRSDSPWPLDANLRFVGCTPDGKNFVSELREYQLISGLHKLGFWGGKEYGDGFGWKVRKQTIIRSSNLDPTETVGYAFSADGKTFRTIAPERDEASEAIKKLTVIEVDAGTGKHLKKLLSLSASIYALSTDGKRLATIVDRTVFVYDVDRAAELFKYNLPEVAKLSVRDGGRTVNNIPPNVTSPALVFSPGGHRLLIYGGFQADVYQAFGGDNNFNVRMIVSGPTGQMVVVDADTGKALPALEGIECADIQIEFHSFTGDGRLLALRGTQYVVSRDKEGKEKILTEPKAFFKIWDTQTGKVLKSWNKRPHYAFNPARPVLAILEANQDETRMGLWDFSAEVAEKK